MRDDEIGTLIDLLKLPFGQRQDLWFCITKHPEEFGGLVEKIRLMAASSLTAEKANELARVVYDSYLQTPTYERNAKQDAAAAACQEARLKTASVEAPPVIATSQPPKPVSGDPISAILEFMADNRGENYTYNQVAQATGVFWRDASDILKKLAKAKQFILLDEIADSKGNVQKVYRYAPERIALDIDRTRANEVVGKIICDILADSPYMSLRGVREAVRDYLGRIDNSVVDVCLSKLVESGKVAVSKGHRRANLHCLVSVC